MNRAREIIKNQPIISTYFSIVDILAESIADYPECEEILMNVHLTSTSTKKLLFRENLSQRIKINS